MGLMKVAEQEQWIEQKVLKHGFSLRDNNGLGSATAAIYQMEVRLSQEQMLRGKLRSGHTIQIFSVLYDGVLAVTDADAFRSALRTGIGHGKVMGLGLLTVAPAG